MGLANGWPQGDGLQFFVGVFIFLYKYNAFQSGVNDIDFAGVAVRSFVYVFGNGRQGAIVVGLLHGVSSEVRPLFD
jgi:hypothetical protein